MTTTKQTLLSASNVDIWDHLPSDRVQPALADMVGKTVTDIDVDRETNRILFTFDDGRQMMFYHDQDCCEFVRITSASGFLCEMRGRVESVEVDIKSSGDDDGHRTETTYNFRIGTDAAIVQWIGDSNGYYSESVNLVEFATLATR